MIRAARRLLCALVCVGAAAWAQTTPLVGDAYIDPGLANNFGGTANVEIGGSPGSQGLLQFDLTELPVGSSISLATLLIFVNRVGTAGSVNVYAASGSWTESAVNGLSGGPVPGTLVAGNVPVSVADSYIAIPVTSQVQAWLAGSPNNGFIITANSTTSMFFDSKESTSTGHPAVLQVDLFGAGGAT